MTANPTLPITYGTVSGSPITGNVNSATLASKVFITLSANYARAVPPGYPRADAGAAIATSLLAFPQTIAGGTRLQLFSDEAQALVTAGAAAFS